jgi:plasmid stability protein
MSQLTIELPETLAKVLEQAAAAEHKTVEELALERLTASLSGRRSPGDALAAIRAGMSVDAESIQLLNQAIETGKALPNDRPLFED